MIISEIKPIHNFKADGNSIVDVVIYQGDLWVRVINYLPNQNKETLIPKDSDSDNLGFGRQINRLIVKALKYCLEMSQMLTLADLSKETVEILKLIQESDEGLNFNGLEKITKLSRGIIKKSIHHLSDKHLIIRVGFEKYAFQDQIGHLRSLYEK